jgi:transcriptional regulator with XRE-family HTH domain
MSNDAPSPLGTDARMSERPETHVSDDVSPFASIGRRIRVARTQLGMTQAQFAVAVNVHKASLSSLETGARPRKDTVEKIAAFLNRPVHDLDPDGWAYDRHAPQRVNAVRRSAQHAAIVANARPTSH